MFYVKLYVHSLVDKYKWWLMFICICGFSTLRHTFWLTPVTSVTSEQPFQERCSGESVWIQTSRKLTPVSTHSVGDWTVKESVRFQVLPLCITTISIIVASVCGSAHRQILFAVRHCPDLAPLLVLRFCVLLVVGLLQWGLVCHVLNELSLPAL